MLIFGPQLKEVTEIPIRMDEKNSNDDFDKSWIVLN